jgi:hypothetical protein
LDREDLDLDSGEFVFPPTSRPIQPYDPYRTTSSDPSRRETRNVARSNSEPPRRPSSSRSPFLDDDDPLNADAWQLDFDDTEIVQHHPNDQHGHDFPEFEPEPPPRERSPRERRTRRTAEAAAPPRSTSRRSRERSSAVSQRAPRAPITLSMPQAVTGASLVADPTALLLLALNVVSIVLMALILGIRLGAMPNPMVLRLDAAGNPNRWGPPSALWRLPLMGFFLTIMFLVVAWFLHALDRFASRFALGSALVAQLIAWGAILQYLFAG